jgi:hypothetical protein
MNSIIYEFLKVAVPIAIILIELAIGYQLYNAIKQKEEADETSIEGVRPRHDIIIVLWSIAGFALAAVLPSIGLALMFASTNGSKMTTSQIILAVAIGLLSWFAHGYLVFSGEQTQIAKEFVVYKWQRRRIMVPLKRQYRQLESQLSAITILLNKYLTLIKELTQTYSVALTKKVIAFIEKYYGYNPFGGAPSGGNKNNKDSQGDTSSVFEKLPIEPVNSPRGNHSSEETNEDNNVKVCSSDYQNATSNNSSTDEREGNRIETPEAYLRQIIENQIRNNENKVKP